MPDEPLRTITFTLTRADALAYEQAVYRPAPSGIALLGLWLGLWGASALLIPPDWAGPRLGWSFSLIVSILIAIAYVLALLLLAIRQWRRAHSRVKRAREVTVAEWPDRLEIDSAGSPRSLAFSSVRRSILTRTHLFLESGGEPAILPRRAFAEEGTLEALEKRVAEAPKSESIMSPPQTEASRPAPADSAVPPAEPVASKAKTPKPRKSQSGAAESGPSDSKSGEAIAPPPKVPEPEIAPAELPEPARPVAPPPPPAPPPDVAELMAALAAPLEPLPGFELAPLPSIGNAPAATPAGQSVAPESKRSADGGPQVDPASPSA